MISSPVGSLQSYLGSFSTISQKVLTPSLIPRHRKSNSTSDSIEPIFRLPKISKPQAKKRISKAKLIPKQSRTMDSTSINLEKKDHKLKLDIDHHIIRALVSIEEQAESSKDNTILTQVFHRMSEGMKDLHENFTLKNDINRPKIDISQPMLKDKPNLIDAKIKVKSSDRDIWIKKHGHVIPGTENKDFFEFIKDLFDALDEDNNKHLSPDEIIIPLIALGLCETAEMLEKILITSFDGKSLNDIVLYRENFICIFREDRKLDIMIKSLDFHTKNMINCDEDNEYLRKNKEIEENPMKKLPKCYCVIEDYIRMIKKWWSEIKSRYFKVTDIQIGEFMVGKGLVSNKHEGSIMISSQNNKSKYITYEDFEKVFYKAIFKAELLNLAYGLQGLDLNEESSSVKLKFTMIQRQLMMTGTKPRASFHDKGRIVLDSLDKYRRSISSLMNKSNYEFDNSLDEAEKQNQTRIHDFLYSIKESAHPFLDQRGNLRSNIRNTWDVRENISESHSPVDENATIGETSINDDRKSPYSKNVKIFRENYLLTEFSKNVSKYPKRSRILNSSLQF
ncbi:unnamed protein product [Blepharisma stoltei]|uniref:EF-hand domain-containing protein n=1 Tax=Blepharisma stoltei TaxID=1481888 RepID=A0AAU9JBJ1_9CILI|nr:unnamed protein product [Blepharisma stoltei]